MITQNKRNAIRQRIHTRIREKLSGTMERPRLNVYRSLNPIYALVIDDHKGETIVSGNASGRAVSKRRSEFCGGSSSVFKNALAACVCIRSASRIIPIFVRFPAVRS